MKTFDRQLRIDATPQLIIRPLIEQIHVSPLFGVRLIEFKKLLVVLLASLHCSLIQGYFLETKVILNFLGFQGCQDIAHSLDNLQILACLREDLLALLNENYQLFRVLPKEVDGHEHVSFVLIEFIQRGDFYVASLALFVEVEIIRIVVFRTGFAHFVFEQLNIYL